MWDYSKLKGRTKEMGYRQEDVGIAIGLTPATYSQKLNHKTEFKQSEIDDICKFLDIPEKEITNYFFTAKV